MKQITPASEPGLGRIVDFIKEKPMVFCLLGFIGLAGLYTYLKNHNDNTPEPTLIAESIGKPESVQDTSVVPDIEKPKNRRADNPDSRLLTLEQERPDADGADKYLFTEPTLLIQPNEEVNALIEQSEDKSERLFFQIYKGMSLNDSQE